MALTVGGSMSLQTFCRVVTKAAIVITKSSSKIKSHAETTKNVFSMYFKTSFKIWVILRSSVNISYEK